MENSLKQRIVGAVVLIALAVIFLPAILKEKTQQKPFNSQIPEKPADLVEFQISSEESEKNQVVRSKLDDAENDIRKRKVALVEEKKNLLAEKTASTSHAINITEKDNTQIDNGSSDNSVDKKVVVKDEKKAKQNISNNNKIEEKALEATTRSQEIDAEVAKIKAKVDDPLQNKGAWIVQVASFSNQDNAKKLVAKLKDKKFKAYIRDIKLPNKPRVYRIYIGPYIEKSKANNDLKGISELSGSQGMLLEYDSLKH